MSSDNRHLLEFLMDKEELEVCLEWEVECQAWAEVCQQWVEEEVCHNCLEEWVVKICKI